ncbi:contractile injection system tape measure protein [Rhodonellum sp.]|uniref:contractile injection system tape measure protein n=1 Tax=Rhodonellum sp. TaxID=2231180 RepID=UPI00271FF2A7|nr:contractile injection system tape measure protein [Rhodonellum sp.]MDO9554651.1 contractile injection system tape measure protein [Rhodonellum sp.]
MSMRSNIIQKSTIQFRYQGKAQANRCNNVLEQIFGLHLLPEMDKAITAVSPEAVSIEMERLEIDLGQINEEDLLTRLGPMIREAMEKALSKAMEDQFDFLKQRKSNDMSRDQDLDLEALTFYFLKGYFPYWYEKKLELIDSMEKLLLSNPLGISRMMIQNARNLEFTKRIAFGLPLENFDKLLGVLRPNEATWILEYRGEMLNALQEEKVFKSKPFGLEKSINLFILRFNLEDTGGSFNKLKFSERILKQTAAHYNMDFGSLINQMVKALEILEKDTLSSRHLGNVLKAIQNQNQMVRDDFEVPTPAPEISWLKLLNNNTWEAFKYQVSPVEREKISLFFIRESGGTNILDNLKIKGLYNLIQLLSGQASAQIKEMIQRFFTSERIGLSGFSEENELRVLLKEGVWAITESGSKANPMGFWFGLLVRSALKVKPATGTLIKALEEFGENEIVGHSKAILSKEITQSAIDSDVRWQDGKFEMKSTGGLGIDEKQIKNKIIRHYLVSGILSPSQQDLGKQDIRRIFEDLLQEGEVLISKLIEDAVDPSELLYRLNQLINRKNQALFLNYLNKQFEHLIFDFLEVDDHSVPATQSVLATVAFRKNLLSALILGKGNRKSSVFKFYQAKYHLSWIANVGDSPDKSKRDFATLDAHLSEFIGFLDSLDPSLGLKIGKLSRDLFWYKKIWEQPFPLFAGQITKIKKKNFSFETRDERSGIRKALLQSKYVLERLFKVAKNSEEDFTAVKSSIHEIQRRELRQFADYLRTDVTYRTGQAYPIEMSLKKIFAQHLVHPEPLIDFIRNNKGMTHEIVFHFKKHLSKKEWAEISKNIPGVEGMDGFPKNGITDHHTVLNNSFDVLVSILRTNKPDPKRLRFYLARIELGEKELDKLSTMFSPQEITSIFYGNDIKRIDNVNRLLELPGKLLRSSRFDSNWLKAVFEASIHSFLKFGVLDTISDFPKGLFDLLKDSKIGKPVLMALKIEISDFPMLEKPLEESEQWMIRELDADGSMQKRGFNVFQKDKTPGYHPISDLHFWVSRGYLPWWSRFKTICNILLDLGQNKLPLSQSQEESLGLLFMDTGFLDKVSEVFSLSEMGEIVAELGKKDTFRPIQKFFVKYTSKLSHHSKSEMKTESKSGFLSPKLDVSTVSLFKNMDKETWIFSYQTDKSLLDTTIYHQEDKVLSQKFFKEDPRIKKQVLGLLMLSKFMYFGNLNAVKWRKMVFEFSLQYYSIGSISYTEKFHVAFLIFIKRKYAIYNWKGVFQAIYLRSEKKEPDAVLPPAFVLEFGLDRKTLAVQPENKGEVGDQVRIGNAGLILAWPFLTMLFGRLGLLDKNQFVDEKAQNKAVYLLQYMAFGHMEFPEYELVLNKLLVGLPANVHLEQESMLTEEESTLINSLLNGMLNNWEKLKNSSIQAMQETFIQREGVLKFENTQTSLKVDSKGVDVLLDSISWNFKMVKLPWMEKPLQITWR